MLKTLALIFLLVPIIILLGFYEDKLDKIYNTILQGQTATNLMLNRILAKIEVIEANYLKNTPQTIVPTVYIDQHFLSYFPLKNAD